MKQFFNKKNIKARSLAIVLLLSGLQSSAQTGNYVFSGAEAANFGILNLTTSTNWATDRSAAPGYFSAVGTATYAGAADVSYNINGYNKWYATAAGQSYTAPVGDGTQLRNLTISGSTAGGNIFATAWWNGDATTVADPTAPNAGTHAITSVGAGIAKISPVGFWDWQDISGTGAGKTITVDIPDMTAFSAAANLRLAGWNGTQWVSLSASATATGNTNHTTVSGTIQAGITAIALGGVVSDLTPTIDIDGLSFNAAQSRDFVVNIFEILGAQTSGTVSFRVSRISGWDITVPGITLTATDQSGIAGSANVGGGTVYENDKWLFRQNAGFITVTLKSAFGISGLGLGTLGFTATRKAGTATGTVQNITATIINGSGGEIDFTNNLVITNITAN